MSLKALTSELMATGARVGPLRFLGAVNPVYQPADQPASDPAPGSAPADPPSTVLGGKDATPPPAPAPAEDDKAKAEREKAERKAARQNELEAMSPEERAKAEAEDAEAERLATVPEDGKYDLRMPEGVTLDQELLDQVAPEFKELGLTNGQAQKLADKFAAHLQARAKASAEAFAAQVAAWADEARADPEIGGGKWDNTVLHADRAMRKFGSPGLREYLEKSGAGNHPDLIRAFAKVGATIADDDPAISETPAARKQGEDRAARMYPADTPKGP